MKYKYENIKDLEQLKNILLKEIADNNSNKKFISGIYSYLGEVIDKINEPFEDINGCNELIRDILGFLNSAYMVCPMCQEEKMKHIEYKGTHIYICEPCPFIGFEYVEQKDIDNLKEYLGGK